MTTITTTTLVHPQRNHKGQPVVLHHPSTPTPLANWTGALDVALVVPGGAMPPALNGIAFDAWHDVPTQDGQWQQVAGQCLQDEPVFEPMPGKAAAAGVVILECDGRVWLVAPSNAFGGYQTTFPKGRVEAGGSLQSSAIREAYEESGLQVRITGWLADVPRAVTYTRYYLAERVAGNPAAMGWESQAVLLVPRAELGKFLTHPNDQPLLQAILALPAPQ